MVNFGPLPAENDSVVWGTPASFNGFRVMHFGPVGRRVFVSCVAVLSATWLRNVADRVRLCTPVLDMMSINTQYTVVAVSAEEHNQICQ